MIPKWSSWVLRPVSESLTSPSQRASWRLSRVRLSAWRAFFPDSSQPKSCRSRYWVNGHRRRGGVLELQPPRAEPDDGHVAVAADGRARGLADRPEPVGDRDARGDLEALARARAVGEAVLEGLLEPAQVIRLTQRELCFGAAQLELVRLCAGALARAQILAGTAAGRGLRRPGGGGTAISRCSVARRADALGAARTRNRGNRLARRGRAANAARPATALIALSLSY